MDGSEDFQPQHIESARSVVSDKWRQGYFWYVYLLLDDDFEPFYVGKGTRGRFGHHVFSASKPRYKFVQFVYFCLFEKEAYLAEHEIIASFKAQGRTLVNKRCGRSVYAVPRLIREKKGSKSYLKRLKLQGRRSGQMYHVRRVRSGTATRLNYDAEFNALKYKAIVKRYALRRRALNLLKTRPLPAGFDLPRNRKVGGTTKFWSDLLQALRKE